MPKQEFSVLPLHGGINNNTSSRDIENSEVQDAQDVVLDSKGTILSAGKIVNESFSMSTTNIEPGYGLFSFGMDYHVGSSGNGNYLAIAGYGSTGNFVCKIYEDDGTSYASSIELNVGDTEPFYPVFYYSDGFLYITDANFNTTSVTKSIGYSKKNLFPIEYQDTYGYVTDTFVANDVTLTPPSRGFVADSFGFVATTQVDSTNVYTTYAFSSYETQFDNGDYYLMNITDSAISIIESFTNASTDYFTLSSDVSGWDTDTMYIAPPAGNGCIVSYNNYSSAGSWNEATLAIAIAYVYRGGQYSPLYQLTGTISVNDGDIIVPYIIYTGPYASNIEGLSVFYKRYGYDDNWYLFSEANFEKGYRCHTDEDWHEFEYLSSGISKNIFRAFDLAYSLKADDQGDTYETMSGIEKSTDVSTIRYKTAVVANRATYIGNVKYNGELFEDSVFKSHTNKFQSFEKDRRLEIASGDGDKIVKLEEFADRLLVFKEKTLYIINISQEIEFLEDRKDLLGIKYPYQVCRSEYGIAWVNQHGIYLYNGNTVMDLINKINTDERLLSYEYFDDFIGDNPTIFYDYREKRLIIVSTISGSTAQDVLIYSLKTGSFTLGVDKIDLSAHKFTNFVLDWNKKPITFDSSTEQSVYSWDYKPSSTTSVSIETKEYTFDNKSNDKRFYGVDIVHKGFSADAMSVKYSLNGDSAYSSFSTTYLTSSTSQVTTEFRTTSIQNAKSVTLQLSGDMTSNCEITDIVMIYRPKGIRS